MTRFIVVATAHGVQTLKRSENEYSRMALGLLGHHVTSMVVDGGILVAGTLDGVFRSIDHGVTWRIAGAGLKTRCIRWMTRLPHEPYRILAGTEPASIFFSDDRGIGWHECPEVPEIRDSMGWYLPYSPNAGCVRDFASHESRCYAAIEVGGLLRSDSSGRTWGLVAGCTGEPVAQPATSNIHPDVHSVEVHPTSPNLVLAPTGGGLYRSDNAGASWQCLYRCYCRAVWLDPHDPDHLLLGPADSVSHNGRIEESVDGGKSWHTATAGLPARWPLHMVERFVQLGDELLAILSNGHIISSSATRIAWHPILEDVGHITIIRSLGG